LLNKIISETYDRPAVYYLGHYMTLKEYDRALLLLVYIYYIYRLQKEK
jgi:hypothetical protein